MEERLHQLEQEVERLRDRESVRDTLILYSRALDWLDESLLDRVFFDDAAIDYGFFKGDGKTFKPLLIGFERNIGRRWHFTSQVDIAMAGKVAHARSYNISLAIDTATPSPPADVTQFMGYFVDRLECREGHWAIAARKHLLVTGTTYREIAMEGAYAGLNQIGETSPAHPDYRVKS